jgi:tripartite-type tricarboxylate transporter receptor subunit TctC
MSIFNRRSLLGAIALSTLAPLTWAQTGNFPNRPVKIIVNFPAGGYADTIARLFSTKLSEALNVPVVVDNKAGAGGTIGADFVAKAAPDGYTLLLTPFAVFTVKNPEIKVTYSMDDFVPVTPVVATTLVVVASESSKISSLADLSAYAKNNRISYGTYGPNTTTHIGQHRLLKQLQAKDAVAISYRGEAPMLTDLLGGQIQIGVVSPLSARENQKLGKLRILGVTGPKRYELLPDVPSLKEQGIQGVDWSDGVVVFASSKTPPALLEQLQAASKKVMSDDNMLKTLRSQSNVPWLDTTSAALKAQMVADTVFWEKAQAEMAKGN